MSVSRPPRYLRVSLLSACNLNCSYCRPEGQVEPALVAPVDKLCAAIELLHRSGIRRIRFTGGEPTLHKHLSTLVARVKGIDSDVFTALTTNGVLLKKLAPDLSSAGLDSVNISLDTLDPVKFRALTGKDNFDRVISGIDAALYHIGRVKLNSVLVRGTNEREVHELIMFADQRGLDIRFIEYMPNRFSTPGDERFISGDDIRCGLPWKLSPLPFRPADAARYYATPELGIRVGFISPISHPFCDGCDRIRLAADGMLYACLFGSGAVNLFDLMADDSRDVETELENLSDLKRLGGCRDVVDTPGELPSFSALGG